MKNNIYLSKKVKIYSENTYSKYSFITHKQCLILYLDSEASIMTSDSLKIYSLNGKFLILNCFYYKSDNENSKVVYVELN